MLIKKTHITCPSFRYIKWYASCILLRLFWTFLLQAPRKRRRLSQKHEDTSFCGVSYPYRPTCLTLGRDVRVGDLPLSANICLLLLVIKWVDLLKTLCQYCRVSGISERDVLSVLSERFFSLSPWNPHSKPT